MSRTIIIVINVCGAMRVRIIILFRGDGSARAAPGKIATTRPAAGPTNGFIFVIFQIVFPPTPNRKFLRSTELRFRVFAVEDESFDSTEF